MGEETQSWFTLTRQYPAAEDKQGSNSVSIISDPENLRLICLINYSCQ